MGVPVLMFCLRSHDYRGIIDNIPSAFPSAPFPSLAFAYHQVLSFLFSCYSASRRPGACQEGLVAQQNDPRVPKNIQPYQPQPKTSSQATPQWSQMPAGPGGPVVAPYQPMSGPT
ncbi:unnamed protein product, partial [Prorocentrum cordatum]